MQLQGYRDWNVARRTPYSTAQLYRPWCRKSTMCSSRWFVALPCAAKLGLGAAQVLVPSTTQSVGKNGLSQVLRPLPLICSHNTCFCYDRCFLVLSVFDDNRNRGYYQVRLIPAVCLWILFDQADTSRGRKQEHPKRADPIS